MRRRTTRWRGRTGTKNRAHKSLEIPALLADILRTGLKGEANLGIEHHAGEDVARLLRELIWKLSAGMSAKLRLARRGRSHRLRL